MILSVSVEVVNAVLLLRAPTGEDIPTALGDGGVAASRDCLAVGARAEGPTRLILTDDSSLLNVETTLSLKFAGTVETQGREFCFYDVDLRPLLTLAVAHDHSQVEVWTDHDVEPDTVLCLVIGSR